MPSKGHTQHSLQWLVPQPTWFESGGSACQASNTPYLHQVVHATGGRQVACSGRWLMHAAWPNQFHTHIHHSRLKQSLLG